MMTRLTDEDDGVHHSICTVLVFVNRVREVFGGHECRVRQLNSLLFSTRITRVHRERTVALLFVRRERVEVEDPASSISDEDSI